MIATTFLSIIRYLIEMIEVQFRMIWSLIDL